MRIYYTPEKLVERMKKSDGFVVILNDSEAISVIVDSDKSIELLANFIAKYSTTNNYPNVKSEDFNPNLN